jgi:hypothetical protein
MLIDELNWKVSRHRRLETALVVSEIAASALAGNVTSPLILESSFRRASVMIVVQYAPGLTALMREFFIWPQHVLQAVNDRDLGLVDDGVTRVVALKWFDGDHALLVDARITSATHDFSGVRIHAVMVNLAIWIRRLMPGGRIASDANLHDVLHTAAKSFGLSVTCHPQCRAQFLYAGPWDGTAARVQGMSDNSVVFICGSFNKEKRACELVWALDLSRYRAWFFQNVAASLKTTMTMSPEEFLLAQRTMLEALCGRDWFHSRSRIVQGAHTCPSYPRRCYQCRRDSRRIPSLEVHGH